MIKNIMRNRSGIGIIEVITAMLIISFMAVLCVIPPATILRRILDRHIATTLVKSQIEDLKCRAITEYRTIYINANSSLLKAGVHNSTLAAGEIPAGFTLIYNIEDKFDWTEDYPASIRADYKIVTVSCEYGNNGNVRLRAYIADNF